ncbi:MAG: hypothetical protein KDB53_12475, partial [Planctomycetes bacterium]|nr:hypothetical protein [Planctomycetota bacterium]
MVSGPTNAALISYAGIGQFDIGTGLDLMTGIPAGISRVVSGTRPTFPHVAFRTNAAGTVDASFPMIMAAPGYITT